MKAHDVFWKLRALSDRQLLDRVGSVLGSSRRMIAELIAHLGEVEERRLHLAAACSSMFAYCMKLGMTEDEAYRRIEVARLARRYPAIFPLLADGQLSLSVVALLKHHLSAQNHLELLAAVTGKSVGQTRELIAARFPRPDVPSSVRKLPERRTTTQPSLALSPPTAPHTRETGPSNVTEPHTGGTGPSNVTEPPSRGTVPSNITSSSAVSANPVLEQVATTGGSLSSASALQPICTPAPEGCTLPTRAERVAPPRVSSRIEPLSAQRYKVQLTASAELVRKLELAKDLMRHSHPDGDLGPIVERALDLLIENLMQRRFGMSKKASPKRTCEHAKSVDREPHATSKPRTSAHVIAESSAKPTREATEPSTVMLDAASTQVDGPGEPERASSSSYIPRSTRRAVLERDGLGCSYIDEHGLPCGSRAWLEYDHHHPRAKGGGSDADNLRLLCRHHNRFAAERAYGRKHVEHTIAERRRARAPHGSLAT